MLHHPVAHVGLRLDGGLQRLPVDGAVADIGPAVLVHIRACRRDVLHVHGIDARAVFLDPGSRILTAADHPGDVHFPLVVGGRLEEDVHRQPAALGGLELEVMVVPTEAETVLAEGLAQLRQRFAQFDPLGFALRALFFGDGRAIEHLHAERFGDLERRRGVLELAEPKVPGRHAEPVFLDAGREAAASA